MLWSRVAGLASEGVRLTQNYVQEMCTPTRAALMTSRYPFRYGMTAYVDPARPCHTVFAPWAAFAPLLDAARAFIHCSAAAVGSEALRRGSAVAAGSVDRVGLHGRTAPNLVATSGVPTDDHNETMRGRVGVVVRVRLRVSGG